MVFNPQQNKFIKIYFEQAKNKKIQQHRYYKGVVDTSTEPSSPNKFMDEFEFEEMQFEPFVPFMNVDGHV